MEGRQGALLQEVGPKPVEGAATPKEGVYSKAEYIQPEQNVENLLNEIDQQTQLHLLPSLCCSASPVKATPDMQPSSCQWHPEAMHNAILKNQETLRMVLTNQDTLKNLMDQLQNIISNIEARIQALEQRISIFALFNREIDRFGDESDFNEIDFCS